MENNRIPRNFKKLTGTMLVDTSCCRAGDELQICKDECSTKYLATNTRTGKSSYVFVSMLRNTNYFKLTNVA